MIAKFIKLLETKYMLCGLGIFFRLALELSYIDFVSPIYEYAGFELIENNIKYVESWVLYILILLVLPARSERPSDYLMCISFFSFMAPLLVFYSFADPARWILYLVVLQYLIISAVRAGHHSIRILAPRNGPQIATSICVIVIVSATLWMLSTVGLSNFNLDLDAVYDFREQANDAIYSGVMGYVVVWATTVAGPFILMIALRDKRRILTIGVICLHILWFGISSHKSVLFYPTLVLSLYTLFKYSRAMAVIPSGMTLVVSISLIAFYVTESLFLSGMFIRRVYFVPSHLTFTYFDFFSTNSFVYWSNSFLSWLINYPYTESVALVIGNHLNDSTLWANNSFFATGYMHAGVLGVIIYGITAGLIMKILDSSMSQGTPIWMALSTVIIPFNSLFTSADLTTTLLTHGLGFGLFILYLMGGKSAQIRHKPVGLSAALSTDASTRKLKV